MLTSAVLRLFDVVADQATGEPCAGSRDSAQPAFPPIAPNIAPTVAPPAVPVRARCRVSVMPARRIEQ